jgi:hypothetical protein
MHQFLVQFVLWMDFSSMSFTIAPYHVSHFRVLPMYWLPHETQHENRPQQEPQFPPVSVFTSIIHLGASKNHPYKLSTVFIRGNTICEALIFCGTVRLHKQKGPGLDG